MWLRQTICNWLLVAKKWAVPWVKCHTASSRLSAVITRMKEQLPEKSLRGWKWTKTEWSRHDQRVRLGRVTDNISLWYDKRIFSSVHIHERRLAWRHQACVCVNEFKRIGITPALRRSAGGKFAIPWCEHQRRVSTSSLRVLLKDVQRPRPPSVNQFLMRPGDFKQGSDSALLPQRWMYYRGDERSVLYLPPPSTRRFLTHTVDPALVSLIRAWVERLPESHPSAPLSKMQLFFLAFKLCTHC